MGDGGSGGKGPHEGAEGSAGPPFSEEAGESGVCVNRPGRQTTRSERAEARNKKRAA